MQFSLIKWKGLTLSKKLAEIRSILEEHHSMISKAILLIAFENITSPAVDEACICDFSHHYAKSCLRVF